MRQSNPLARARARSIIADWGIEDPTQIDLDAITAELGLIITEKQVHGSAARLVSSGSGGLIIVNKGIREPGRKRFAAAHEIGHFLLHRSRSSVRICTDESFLSWYGNADLESEANEFAAELLMPGELFVKAARFCQPSFEIIEKMSDDFNTTLTATAIRFVELAGHACALVACLEGKVRWFCLSPSFPYRLIGIGSQIDPVSCSGEFFAKGTVTTGPETVPGDAWIENRTIGKNCYLFEDMKALTSYRMTLSLLGMVQDRNKKDGHLADYHQQDQDDPDHFTPDGKRYRW